MHDNQYTVHVEVNVHVQVNVIRTSTNTSTSTSAIAHGSIVTSGSISIRISRRVGIITSTRSTISKGHSQVQVRAQV